MGVEGSNTVVEQLTHNMKIGGSKPAAGTGSEKMAKQIVERKEGAKLVKGVVRMLCYSYV